MRLIDADVLQQRIENELEMANLRQNGYAYCLFQYVLGYIRECPTAFDVDKIVNGLENCEDSTTFRYDKQRGILYEVEADVWAEIGNGVHIPIKSALENREW